jgi:AraC family transcriptional activator of pobA
MQHTFAHKLQVQKQAKQPAPIHSFKSIPETVEILPLDKLYNPLYQFQPGKWQRQPSYLVFFVTDGDGKYQVDFKEYRLKKGDVAFVAPGQVHRFQKKRTLEGWVILFSGDFFATTPTDKQLLEQSTLFDPARNEAALTFPPRFYVEARFSIQQLHDERQREPDWAQTEILRKHLAFFLWYCERFKRSIQPAAFHDHYLTPYIQFKQILETHLNAQRSVAFYAQQLHISTKSLNRISHAQLKKNAKSCIDEAVLIEIKRTLIQSNKTIQSVCDYFHFDDPANFVKYFKKMTGMTPGVFKSTFRGHEF